jgi:hypothetical protein
MKNYVRILAVFAFFALITFSGCKTTFEYDITLKNGLDKKIQVNLTSSSGFPSTWYTLEQGQSRTFTNLDSRDNHYVHLVVEGNDNYYYKELGVGSDATWTIKKNSSGEYYLE